MPDVDTQAAPPPDPAHSHATAFSPHYLIAMAIAMAGVALVCTIALAWLGAVVLLAGLAYGAIARWINGKRPDEQQT